MVIGNYDAQWLVDGNDGDQLMGEEVLCDWLLPMMMMVISDWLFGKSGEQLLVGKKVVISDWLLGKKVLIS